MRELWGRYWIFAHNGTLDGFAPKLGGRFRPVGTTDSELAVMPDTSPSASSAPSAASGSSRASTIKVKVRGVQVHGRKQPEAIAGNRTAVNVSGVDVADVARGQNLVTPGAFEETRLADATSRCFLTRSR